MSACAHPTFHSPAEVSDAELRAMLSRCSQRSLRARFLGVGSAAVEQCTELLSGAESLVTLAARLDDVLVGIGSVESPAPHELAVLVEDQWQRCGVGQQLTAALAAAAAARGASELYVVLAVDNTPARRLVVSLWPGARFTFPDAGATECVLPLRDRELMQPASRRAPPVARHG